MLGKFVFHFTLSLLKRPCFSRETGQTDLSMALCVAASCFPEKMEVDVPGSSRTWQVAQPPKPEHSSSAASLSKDFFKVFDHFFCKTCKTCYDFMEETQDCLGNVNNVSCTMVT
jgi:hypothetical protein